MTQNKTFDKDRLIFRIFMGLKFINNGKGKNNLIFMTLFAGISGGLAILIVVIGVMNGFQDSYISRRIEIGSYHADIIVNTDKYSDQHEDTKIKNYDEIVETIYKNVPEVKSCTPYADREVILLFTNGFDTDKQPVKLRAVKWEELSKDTKFMEYFKITDGELNLAGNGILLGEELAWKEMGLARNGSEIYLTPDISLKSISAEGVPFQIRGSFKTESYDYDRYWVFIGFDGFKALTGIDAADGVGIKFKNSKLHKAGIEKIRRILGDKFIVRDSETINKAYFSALKLEKTMITLLFAAIFIVVGINIFGALKLTILEKRDSILILKAIGLTPSDIEAVFLMESFILAVGGSVTGTLIGVFISHNILNIFGIFEFIINTILYISHPEFAFTPIKLYDTTIYYQTDFLIKFYPIELILTNIGIVTLTLLSAVIPVTRASRIRPDEISKRVG